ncbi:MAG: 50S ribosomal protein L24 [Candidatus Omnitrophica bacterium]|nr:50S ribosomal protein L24 [Candidatus Omnitrophota bacterium]MDD5670920.1 50S ribosomal protein L24 [Candidatus Omnitrophota bacterium]
MRIRKNDQIVVTAGKDRGKKGRVMRIYPQDNAVLVEKMNYRTVYLRRTQQNPKGGISKMEGKIPIGNVQLICPRCSAPTRVGYGILADGTKQRECKKCHEII